MEKTFQELKSRLDEIDLEAIRNRKQDFPVMPVDELEQILRSKAKTQYKRRLLLTQIGYVRINLFSEYYERLQHAERNKEFEETVKLMNNYVETIAAPFIPAKRQSKFRKRLNAWF
jgi:vacuolar-type H+-ATPase subunit E/Vma4